MLNVLVLNAGSSTLKFQIIAADLNRVEKQSYLRLARGSVERIGGEAIISLQAEHHSKQRTTAPIRDMRAAVDHVLRWACSPAAQIERVRSVGDINAVGHRVVHGGERFKESVLITDDVLQGIEDNIDLAPLHNPANIKGILAARDLFGAGLPQVAVFDTAFHQTLPDHAYMYALPYQLYRRHRIRRYGFHGTSHRYVAQRYRNMTGLTEEQTNIITMHLGNGCSACAIKSGESIDTSMGMTPLEGLVMGTRSGDIDASIVDFIASKEGLSSQEVENLLNKLSGLLGISGLTNDMRELIDEAREHEDRRTRLAIDMFCYRVKKYIGSYLAAMGGADAIVFTGGIGENSAEVRQHCCEGMEWMGLELDEDRNTNIATVREGPISTDASRLKAFVIPTDEELMIAYDTVLCVKKELVGS